MSLASSIYINQMLAGMGLEFMQNHDKRRTHSKLSTTRSLIPSSFPQRQKHGLVARRLKRPGRLGFEPWCPLPSLLNGDSGSEAV
jgi:hypothetical protein